MFNVLVHRHFVKEDLPRIRYANPTLDVFVDKKLKTKEETWDPEMVVELSAYSLPSCSGSPYLQTHCTSAENGTTHTLNMGGKWSSAIFHELMDLSAGSWWARWKAEQAAAGVPTMPPPPQKKTGAAAVLP